MSTRKELIAKVGNRKAQSIWNKILDGIGCYTDSVGNAPCDNGVMCDKCNQQWVQDVFTSRLKIEAEKIRSEKK